MSEQDNDTTPATPPDAPNGQVEEGSSGMILPAPSNAGQEEGDLVVQGDEPVPTASTNETPAEKPAEVVTLHGEVLDPELASVEKVILVTVDSDGLLVLELDDRTLKVEPIEVYAGEGREVWRVDTIEGALNWLFGASNDAR